MIYYKFRIKHFIHIDYLSVKIIINIKTFKIKILDKKNNLSNLVEGKKQNTIQEAIVLKMHIFKC